MTNPLDQTTLAAAIQTQPELMGEEDWTILIERIAEQRCTPFLGAGLNLGTGPTKSSIARDMAARYRFPLSRDSSDLARVAQYVAVRKDPLFPREEFLATLASARSPDFRNPPDFKNPQQPHAILAALRFPIYITTNCDDFMLTALKSHKKDPKSEICRWNEFVRDEPSVLESGFEPTVANPLVFHLHGHAKVPESVVLTEDDYLDFLVNTSRESSVPKPIPTRIERAFTKGSLLFLGYQLPDLEFRVLLRSLVTHLKQNMTKSHISILQVSEAVSAQEIANVQDYLNHYCRAHPFYIKIYWGEASDFLAELITRWKASGHGY